MAQVIFGAFVLDLRAKALRHGRTAIALRPKEFKVLLLLASSRGQTVSKDTLFDAVWKSADVNESVLTQCIYRLRQKLAMHDPHTDHIATIYGLGYRLTSYSAGA